LAVLSRFPITAWSSVTLPHATEQEGRILLSAQVSSPHGEIWVHVTHLSFREHEGCKREDQVQFIEGVMASKVAPIPAGAPNANPHLLMGDFNAPPSCDEIRWLSGQTTLGGRRVFYQDAWDTLRPQEPGITWARENSFRARMNWLRADRRLDYVFVSAPRRDGRGQILDVARVFHKPDADGVFPSDHYGVLARVQMAPLPPKL
jgi:endonuclease/exonuclease/phosphatase family metal-dependent hydrolase